MAAVSILDSHFYTMLHVVLWTGLQMLLLSPCCHMVQLAVLNRSAAAQQFTRGLEYRILSLILYLWVPARLISLLASS